MSLFASELSKLAHNAFLAQRVSVNSLSAICEVANVDISDVTRSLGMNERIGSQYLQPSRGFGGSCLTKDTASLVYLARSLGLHEIAEYWRQVLRLNDLQKARFATRIASQFGGQFRAKEKIAVLGFAYKAETRDPRGTPVADIVLQLLKYGASVALYDPNVTQRQMEIELFPLATHTQGTNTGPAPSYCSSLYAACDAAHCIVVMNNCPEFNLDMKSAARTRDVEETGSPATNRHLDSSVDWSRVATSMEGAPKYLFDGVNTIDEGRFRSLGFRVLAVGRGTVVNV